MAKRGLFDTFGKNAGKKVHSRVNAGINNGWSKHRSARTGTLLALAAVLLKGCGWPVGSDAETVQVLRPSGWGSFTVTSYTPKRRKVRDTILAVQSSLGGTRFSLAVHRQLRDDWGLEPWEAQNRWCQLLSSRNFRLHLEAKLMDVDEDQWSQVITHEALVWFVSSVGTPSYVHGGVRVAYGPSLSEQRRLTRAMARLAEIVADDLAFGPGVVDLSARRKTIHTIYQQPESFYTRVKSVQNATGIGTDTSLHSAKTQLKSLQNESGSSAGSHPASHARTSIWHKNHTNAAPHRSTGSSSKNVSATRSSGGTHPDALSLLSSRRKNKPRNTDTYGHPAGTAKNTYTSSTHTRPAPKNPYLAPATTRTTAKNRSSSSYGPTSVRPTAVRNTITPAARALSPSKNALRATQTPAPRPTVLASTLPAPLPPSATQRKNKRRNTDGTSVLAPATLPEKNALDRRGQAISTEGSEATAARSVTRSSWGGKNPYRTPAPLDRPVTGLPGRSSKNG